MQDEAKNERFLHGQQLRELKTRDSELVKALVCLTHEAPVSGAERQKPEDLWEVVPRSAIVDRTAKAQYGNGSRFGLVCDAGLGKSANMLWLHDMFLDIRFRPQLPFLLRFEDKSDLKLLKAADKNKDVLLERFTRLVHNSDKTVSKKRIRHFLTRKRDRGHITLLLDGLDHALAMPEATRMLAELLDSDHWKKCPVWVSGRPYAFGDAWDSVFRKTLDHWTFIKVDPLRDAEIQEYLTEKEAGDWFLHSPSGCRRLLSTPRLLKLICDIVKRDRKSLPSEMPWAEVMERINLNTPAKVYYRAYFDKGEPNQPDTQGLIAQGLKGKAGRIGLKDRVVSGVRDREPAVYDNLQKRIERAGVLLGATAFHLFNMGNQQVKPEPNTSGADLDNIRKDLISSLDEAGQGNEIDFSRDYGRLRKMNTNHLQFLLAQARVDRVRFPDRTVQAFFAAYWATKFSTPKDRKNMRKWVIDKQGKALQGFDEFWQFAAEMPDKLVDKDRWHETFAPCFAEPKKITGSHALVQWHRRMLYHSFPSMKRRFQGTVDGWQNSFNRLETSHDPEQGRIWNEIRGKDVFCDIPSGICHFGADPLANPPDPGNPREVKGFQLHRYPVTNEMYELFDPAHQTNRWYRGSHPLAKEKDSDNNCPVVNVTWFDAWCFATWCGCKLPTELEWEHALRADQWDTALKEGGAYGYSFGDDEEQLGECAWYSENSEGSSHPVGERPRSENKHRLGLYDMHGNVWEWCDDWFGSEQTYRVLRGGSWYDYARGCRAADRGGVVPGGRDHVGGFRLRLPGPI